MAARNGLVLLWVKFNKSATDPGAHLFKMKKLNCTYEGVVYRYVNNDKNSPEYGWCYVGNTLDEKERRRKWRNAKTGTYGGKKITEARQRVGIDNFSYEVLERKNGTDKNALKKELDDLEEKYITKYNSTVEGYNSSRGGTGNKGIKKSPEEIERRNATRKANGFHHTQETKDRLSQKLKGRKRSPEICKKISASKKGKKQSEEHRQHLSESLKGRTMSPEARAKSSATKKGVPHPISPQGLENIRKSRFKQTVVAIAPDGTRTEYESGSAAARALEIGDGSISRCLKDSKAKTKNGYRFEYKDGIKKIPKCKQKP